MKRTLLLAAVLTASVLISKAQTKGTNAVGFGIQSQKQESEQNGTSWTDSKINNYSLSYGHFVNDNTKLELTFGYGKTDQPSYQKMNRYQGIVAYQKYYPLLKKFYATAGGRVSYIYGKYEDSQSGAQNIKANDYGIGAYGGAAYFLSKRFAFEATLLSADFSYSKMESQRSNAKQTNTSLNISSQGVINDLTFKIYFLF